MSSIKECLQSAQMAGDSLFTRQGNARRGVVVLRDRGPLSVG